MAIYLNPGNDAFRLALNSQIYVDKTDLIEIINQMIDTNDRFICVSRPRRFGKSMTANMLTAYYDKSVDSKSLFYGKKITDYSSFETHLNKYNVLFLNIQTFLSRAPSPDTMIHYLEEKVVSELKECYPDIVLEETKLAPCLERIYVKTKETFIIILDEWDCIFREKRLEHESQVMYLDFLRDLLKDKTYVSLAYMTGILPVKKYGTHSALNMFSEYSMTNPKILAKYTGFTESEVQQLCFEYDMDFEVTKSWYDGYHFRKEAHIYNPKSVVECMRNDEYDSYWTQTETYEALKYYIVMNFDGLKDAVIDMLSGTHIKINTFKFQNDMTTFQSKDDVLTLLIHLGYLAYDATNQEVFIPNKEVELEFQNAIEGAGWDEVISAIKNSDELLKATISGNSAYVAKAIEQVHMDNTSILMYNDENSLRCVMVLAYFSAKRFYTIHHEFASGKGYADLVLIPMGNPADYPAMIIELKRNKGAESAIKQIIDNRYDNSLKKYAGNLLMVGMNYDEKTKEHTCIIQRTTL
mgnify:CR=1 FL=1